MTVTDKANKFIIFYITVGLVCINAQNQKSYLRFKEGGKYTKENVSDIERYLTIFKNLSMSMIFLIL